jgi:hypothetical protein
LLRVYTEDLFLMPDLSGSTVSPGITAYDGNLLNDVFSSIKKSWRDIVSPTNFAIQVVVFRDGTAFKFSMQHAAGDAVGKYKILLLNQHGVPNGYFKLCTMQLQHSATGFMVRYHNERSNSTGNTELPAIATFRIHDGRCARGFGPNKLASGGISARGTFSSLP